MSNFFFFFHCFYSFHSEVFVTVAGPKKKIILSVLCLKPCLKPDNVTLGVCAAHGSPPAGSVTTHQHQLHTDGLSTEEKPHKLNQTVGGVFTPSPCLRDSLPSLSLSLFSFNFFSTPSFLFFFVLFTARPPCDRNTMSWGQTWLPSLRSVVSSLKSCADTEGRWTCAVVSVQPRPTVGSFFFFSPTTDARACTVKMLCLHYTKTCVKMSFLRVVQWHDADPNICILSED